MTGMLAVSLKNISLSLILDTKTKVLDYLFWSNIKKTMKPSLLMIPAPPVDKSGSGTSAWCRKDLC